MNLRVQRTAFSPYSTIGKLFVDGEFQCFTMEPVWLETSAIKPRAIPEGTYPLRNRYSLKHKRNMPHVDEVPGFTEVEIHPLNFPHETEACLGVGKTCSTDFIGGSKLAFTDLWEKLVPAWGRGETIDITYCQTASAGLQENLKKLGAAEEGTSNVVNVPEIS